MAVLEDPDDGERAARIERERRFHDDRYGDENRQPAAKYYTIDTGRRRYERMVSEAAGQKQTVLELGCGKGSRAFDLSRAGAKVVGIDISRVGVSEATSRAATEDLTAAFVQMDAEELSFGRGTFDLVCGSGILHHLDTSRALAEVRRVLSPTGSVVFYEPLGTNPVINLYRRLTPAMRTADEHPLVGADFEEMRRHFSEVVVEYHNVLSLAGVLVRRLPVIGGPIVRALQRIDGWLLESVPFTRRFAWVTVVRLSR